MVKKKGKSKRVTLKDKYKMQKRVLEKNRKCRKQAKRDAKAGIRNHDKSTKDPGIPNSWPFKQDLLQEIARTRERTRQKEKELKERKRQDKNPTSMEQLMHQAQQDKADFDAKQQGLGPAESEEKTFSGGNIVKSGSASGARASRKAYWKELKKVIDSADVVLQVLDARDPLGTRIHLSVEDVILSQHDKRMVFVLNKIDLVPKDVVGAWLHYLRRSHPTVALKAGTMHNESIGRAASSDTSLNSSLAVGMEGLLQLLKNYARIGDDKKSAITVGIIGYPNVGKSSIINSLKRTRAVGVSSRPGFTTNLQEVVLDKHVRLVDSPGVVFDDGPGALLRNCLDVNSVEDPIPAVEALIQRCSLQSLIMTYNIPAFAQGNVNMFLALVAKSSGRVLTGGLPDKVLAARGVLSDWNSGKIPYFTSPPEVTSTVTGEAAIVSKFAKEFDAMDQAVMNDLADNDEMDFVHLNALEGNDVAAKEAVQFLTEDGRNHMGEDDEEMQDSESDDVEPQKCRAVKNSTMADAEDYDFDDL